MVKIKSLYANLNILLALVAICVILYHVYRRQYGFYENFQAANESNAIVIVEPRRHKLLAPIIDNFDTIMYKSWDLYIFHGKTAADYLQPIVSKITNRRVFLIPLDADNFTADDYNALLKRANFWDQVDAENILVFQTDTVLCGKSLHRINDFMKFEYIGCPFDDKQIGMNNTVWDDTPFYGIGGLSFRKKSFMLKCAAKYPDFKGGEDVMFSVCMNDFGINKPTADDLNRFCTQHHYYKNSFGLHKVNKDLQGSKSRLYDYCPEGRILESE